jgi:Iap family predicted aminopeptidase
VIVDPSGAERPVLAVPEASGEPVLHPDGRRIVFAANVARGSNTDLFLVQEDGTDLVRLTRHEAFDGAPRFAADGERLVWTTARWGGVLKAISARLAVGDPPDGLPEICAADARRHVETLAGDDMEGRLAGSLGGQMAASYIAGRFRRAGLWPGGDAGSYFQDIEFVRAIRPGPGNALTVRIGDESVEARLDEDFRPLRFTKNGAVEADTVAVGYGLVIPGGAEDDYAGWGATGRVAVALDGAPAGWGEKHPDHRPAASIARKAVVAAEKQAAALLVVGDLRKEIGGGGAATAPLPVVRLSRSFWERILQKAGKRDVTIRVSLRTDMVAVRERTVNVVGMWPGETDETVVVGAHHDHLGYGMPGVSLGGVTDRIHPGADDNASGVAGLLEIAQAVAAEGRRFRRALVFAAFAGEELGFVGSGHYVARPARPLDTTVAMINLDMIGRLRHDLVYLGGIDRLPQLQGWVEERLAEEGLGLSRRFSTADDSDHAPFLHAGIPSFLFFTGLHGDYHKPTDDAQFINLDGMERVLRAAYRVSGDLLRRADRPTLADAQRGGDPSRANAAYFGIGVDPSFAGEGVRFAYVAADGPAARAGLEAGDVLLEIDGRALGPRVRASSVLRDRRPGEIVSAKVRRKGQILQVKVRLSSWP